MGGDFERTDVLKFTLWEDEVVWKKMILTVSTLAKDGGLERIYF